MIKYLNGIEKKETSKSFVKGSIGFYKVIEFGIYYLSYRYQTLSNTERIKALKVSENKFDNDFILFFLLYD